VRTLLDDMNEEAMALLPHVMLGHSIEEIASITGVSANTRLLHRPATGLVAFAGI
jgi:DNA-directed RNA polymerase specialized sigma24 family protein